MSVPRTRSFGNSAPPAPVTVVVDCVIVPVLYVEMVLLYAVICWPNVASENILASSSKTKLSLSSVIMKGFGLDNL